MTYHNPYTPLAAKWLYDSVATRTPRKQHTISLPRTTTRETTLKEPVREDDGRTRRHGRLSHNPSSSHSLHEELQLLFGGCETL